MKTRIFGLSVGERIVHFDTTPTAECDGQTDGRTYMCAMTMVYQHLHFCYATVLVKIVSLTFV